jgi:outer membrane lipoprotein carrier protein
VSIFRKASWVVAIGVLAMATPIHAASKDATAQSRPSPENIALLNRLQKHYQETNSFRAKFQETISPAGGAKREREGTVYYRKPGRMRWEFAGQDQEVIVSDGKLLYSYQPDLNQVIETPLTQAFKSSSVAAFLLGMGNIERDFDTSIPKQKSVTDGLKHVALKPKNGGDTVEIGIDPATLDLKTLRLTDALGDLTELSFTDISSGAPLSDHLFAFIPPAGADIVEAPQQPNSH